jgi:hypothetical protein
MCVIMTQSVIPIAGNAGGDATYVALVSGWNIGPENPSPLAVQLLVDYITGSLGGPNVCTPRCTVAIVYGYLMVVWVSAGYWHNSYSGVVRFV